MKVFLRSAVFVIFVFLLMGCGNPGDVSDEFYEEYKALGSPKILYSCTVMREDWKAAFADTINCLEESSEENCKDRDYSYEDVSIGYTSSRSNFVGYNALLIDSKTECEESDGKFLVLESEK